MLLCKRCKHQWPPRVQNPKRCPACGSPYWQKPVTRISVSLSRGKQEEQEIDGWKVVDYLFRPSRQEALKKIHGWSEDPKEVIERLYQMKFKEDFGG